MGSKTLTKLFNELFLSNFFPRNSFIKIQFSIIWWNLDKDVKKLSPVAWLPESLSTGLIVVQSIFQREVLRRRQVLVFPQLQLHHFIKYLIVFGSNKTKSTISFQYLFHISVHFIDAVRICRFRSRPSLLASYDTLIIRPNPIIYLISTYFDTAILDNTIVNPALANQKGVSFAVSDKWTNPTVALFQDKHYTGIGLWTSLAISKTTVHIDGLKSIEILNDYFSLIRLTMRNCWNQFWSGNLVLVGSTGVVTSILCPALRTIQKTTVSTPSDKIQSSKNWIATWWLYLIKV